MLAENALMVKTAFSVANKIGAKCIVIHTDPLDDMIFTERVAKKKAKLILVTRKKKLDNTEEDPDSLLTLAKHHISLPRIPLTRIALIKITTTLALSKELVKADRLTESPVSGPGETIIFFQTAAKWQLSSLLGNRFNLFDQLLFLYRQSVSRRPIAGGFIRITTFHWLRSP